MSSWFALGLAVDRISVCIVSRLRPRRPRNRGLIPVRATGFPPLLSVVEIGCGDQRDSYEIRGGSFPCAVPPDLEAKQSDDSRFEVKST
jgi:hypothetical protein